MPLKENEVETVAPETLHLWICCRCLSPRLYGSTPECPVCETRLHDTATYARVDPATPSPVEEQTDYPAAIALLRSLRNCSPEEALEQKETWAQLQKALESDRGDARGWHSINSAPKDGTRILGFVPCSPRHHQMVGSFAPNGNFLSWPGRWKYDPTHWMPLPPAPEEQTK